MTHEKAVESKQVPTAPDWARKPILGVNADLLHHIITAYSISGEYPSKADLGDIALGIVMGLAVRGRFNDAPERLIDAAARITAKTYHAPVKK